MVKSMEILSGMMVMRLLSCALSCVFSCVQFIMGYSYYSIFAYAFLTDFFIGYRSSFFVAAAACMMMTSGPLIGLRIIAGSVNLWLFYFSFVLAMLYQQYDNPEFAEFCHMVPFPVGFDSGAFLSVIALMTQVALFRIERTIRENFLQRRYLAKQKDILLAKISTLDMVEKVCTCSPCLCLLSIG